MSITKEIQIVSSSKNHLILYSGDFLRNGKPLKNESPVARQGLLKNYDSEKIHSAEFLAIGAGQLMSELCQDLARKGAGRIFACDADNVELNNLDRQYFFAGDVEKPKALMLAKNNAKCSSRQGIFGGFHMTFEKLLEEGIDRIFDLHPTVVLIGVDSDTAIVDGTKYMRRNDIPGIIISLGGDAASGMVFIHDNKPDSACWGCIFPARAEKAMSGYVRAGCAGSLIDAPKTAAGIALFAIDTLIQPEVRQRTWNYSFFSFFGTIDNKYSWIKRNPRCPICSGDNR